MKQKYDAYIVIVHTIRRINPFRCHENHRPPTTLKSQNALCDADRASFGACHENLKEDRCLYYTNREVLLRTAERFSIYRLHVAAMQSRLLKLLFYILPEQAW